MKRPNMTLPPHILQEATDWFVDFTQGDIDTQNRADFDAWLRRSPEHVRAYIEITVLWEEADALGKRRTLASDELIEIALKESNVVPGPGAIAPKSLEPDARHDDQALQPDIAVTPRVTPRTYGYGKSRKLVWPRYAIAASLLLAIASAGTWLFLERNTYTTGIGQQQSIALDDGTLIELNSRTKIRVRYKPDERDIELLQGQALFRVAKDHTRPFIVRIDGTSVRAVGTQFDVYRKPAGTIVTVLEGRVAVADARGHGRASSQQSSVRVPAAAPSVASSRSTGTADPIIPSSIQRTRPAEAVPLSAAPGEILLAAGEQLTVIPAKAGAQATPTRADTEAATAWTRRQLVFKATALRDIVDEFNRYNQRQMTISDAAIENTRISGVFSSTDPNTLIRFLKELPNIQVDESAREIRITAKAEHSL